jgi:hypothetical protein
MLSRKEMLGLKEASPILTLLRRRLMVSKLLCLQLNNKKRSKLLKVKEKFLDLTLLRREKVLTLVCLVTRNPNIKHLRPNSSNISNPMLSFLQAP